MKRLNTYILSGATLLALASCEKFLDIVPESDITTPESVFEQRKNVEEMEADCYSFIIYDATPQYNCGLTGGDELVGNQYIRSSVKYPINPLFIGDGLQSVQTPYCGVWAGSPNYYSALRYCNTFLKNVPNTYNMTDVEKKQWMAEVKVLKAYLYFELVRRYGPIVLVPENIDVNSEIDEMKQPRQPIDVCFKEMVDLIDEAIADGLVVKAQKSSSHAAYFSRESALALKAKILVYQASPFYNGNKNYANFKNRKGEQLFPTESDPEKWRIAAEACDAAIEACEDAGIQLVSGNSSESTDLLNTMLDIENSVHAPAWNNEEAIFLVKFPNTIMYNPNKLYTYTLPRVNWTLYQDQAYYNEEVYGSLTPSMKMVEMFYTDRGLPISEDPNWDYGTRYTGMSREQDQTTYEGVVPANTEVLNLHLRREPRFYADIAADRCYWQIGPKKTSTWGTDYNLVVMAHQGELFGTAVTIINQSIPQNISGYYLKKHLYSSIATRSYKNDYVAKGDDPWVVMRLAELYLMQAEAWNEYSGPSQKVYNAINKVRQRAGIPDVQDSWARSYHPEKVTTKDGMRDIIQQETNIELAFEGHRFWNLRRWLKAEQLNEPQYGWNVVANTTEGFYNNWQGPVVVWSKRKFDSPRDYLFPLKSEDVMISGIKQNPGW